MKDNQIKSLLNYSSGLTKVTQKKLDSAKSKDEKVDIISKQFEEIKKKVNELVNDDNSKVGHSDSESYIKLEFDKLNNRIDVMEATEITQQNFLAGLMKTESLSTSSSTGKDSDENESVIDQIKSLFGFDGDGNLELDEILSIFTNGGFALSGLSSAFSIVKNVLGGLGSVITNPYIMIPLAALAATIAVGKLVEDQADKAHDQTERTDTNISGTTQEKVESSFEKYSGGKKLEWYIQMLSDPGISLEEKNRLQAELDNILDKVKGETIATVTENVIDQGSVSTTATNMAMDQEALKQGIIDQEKLIFTTGDRFRSWLFGRDQDKLFTDSLSALDMSALGSLYGESVSASQSITNLTEDYGNLYNTDSEGINFKIDLNKGPDITEFDYANPLKSIKQIAIEYTRLEMLTSSKVTGNEEKIFKDTYEKLFTAFTACIGRKVCGQTYWDDLRIEFSYYKGSSKDYSRSIYNLMPRWNEMEKIYYSKSYDESHKEDNRYASRMTLAQQYSLLGAKLDEHSAILDIEDEFYFLPIMIKVSNKNYTLDKDTRVTLNSTGVMKAFKIHVSGEYSLDDFSSDYDLLADEVLAQNTREAYNELSNSIGMVHMGDYSTDTIVMGQIREYSGLTEKSDQENFARALEKYSYQELSDAAYSKDGEVYNDLLSIVGNQKNLDKILGLLENYQFGYSTHSDDIVESFNEMNPDNQISKEDLNKMLNMISINKSIRDRYMKARSETNKSNKYEEYKKIATYIGLPIGWMSGDQIINFVDRIFQNYVDQGLYDEMGEGKIDLDAAIHAYLGVSGFSTEDLSSSVDLFGLGTADDLKKMGFSDEDIVNFLRLAAEKEALDSQAAANKDGSFDLVYNTNGYSNDTEAVKLAVAEALREAGISDALIELLTGQVALSEGQGAIADAAASTGVGSVDVGAYSDEENQV